MILSISGIDGAGKSSLAKLLAKKLDLFLPEHVSHYQEFPENLTEWYTKGDIDEVVKLDLKAFAKRNEAAVLKGNAVLDRGFQNVIDSACARYQQRLNISYAEALGRVKRVNKEIGFSEIEDKAILLDFQLNDWKEIQEILVRRVGNFSPEYSEYLHILSLNMKVSYNSYDLILNAADSAENNLRKITDEYFK